MQPSVSYIPYAASYHKQTGNIITFSKFAEDNLVKNKRNSEEYESILGSIDESSIEDDSDDGSISMKDIKEIWGGSQIYPDINRRDARLKIRDLIKKTQSEWEIAELSVNSMGKSLYKLLKAAVNELNNSFPNLR